MATSFIHRILLIVPVAKVAAVVAWLQANVDATCPADLGPELNASGLIADAVTHNWQCGAWTDAQCKALLARLCNLASITPPTNNQWNNWTGAQKRAWLTSVHDAILGDFGVYVSLIDNQAGTWGDPNTALTAMGLKIRAGV